MKLFIPLLFVFLWSTGFIGTKYGSMYAQSGDFLSLRIVLNIIIFALLMMVIKQGRMSRQQILHAMVAGILLHGAYLAGVYCAIENGLSAGITAIIVGLQPLLTSFIAMTISKEKLKRAHIFALFLGLGGLILVVSSSLSLEGFTLVTVLFAVLGLLGITFGTLYQKKHCQGQPMLESVFWQYIGCIWIFLFMSYFQEAKEVIWHIELFASLAWLVLVLSVVSILLLMFMIAQGESTKVTSYFYLVPPVTAIQAWLLFDESLSILMNIGMILCAMSVFIVNKPKNNKALK